MKWVLPGISADSAAPPFTAPCRDKICRPLFEALRFVTADNPQERHQTGAALCLSDAKQRTRRRGFGRRQSKIGVDRGMQQRPQIEYSADAGKPDDRPPPGRPDPAPASRQLAAGGMSGDDDPFGAKCSVVQAKLADLIDDLATRPPARDRNQALHGNARSR